MAGLGHVRVSASARRFLNWSGPPCQCMTLLCVSGRAGVFAFQKIPVEAVELEQGAMGGAVTESDSVLLSQ